MGHSPANGSSNSLEVISMLSNSAPNVKNPDPTRVRATAQNAEALGVDTLLMGYVSNRANSWIVGTTALNCTETLRVLVAHRPGVIAPSLFARMTSTLDMLSSGRACINIIAGGSPQDQQREGDFAEHDERYQRADEYLTAAARCWTEPGSVTHSGKYYKFVDVKQEVRPVQKPHPPIYVGGASPPAQDLAINHGDVYMMWGEPLKETHERLESVRRRAAALNRAVPRFSTSFRLIFGDTEAKAWETADSIIRQIPSRNKGPIQQDHGRARQVELAATRLVHDERFWMGIAAATGGVGATAALVGTEEQLISALLEYYKLGISCFQLSSGTGGLIDLSPEFIIELKRRARQLTEPPSLQAAHQ